ncbi:MAG: hypothetical protein M3071_20490, partial [Actinomycetota bacterium]|nr:hypothetical protein [Actinomycetota bacterium]
HHTPAGPPPPALHPVLERHLRAPSGVVDLIAADGSLWVSGFRAVTRIDQASGRIRARITIAPLGDLSQMAAAFGSIWITTTRGGSVYRIDPTTDRVAAVIHAGGPTLGIAAGAGRIWVTRPSETRGDVLQIDPRTNRVVGSPIRVGPGPGQLAYGSGSLWVEDTAPLAVMRIDPASWRATPPSGRATTPAGLATALSASRAGAIAPGYGSLYITANDHLTRFDPATNRVTANVRIPRANAIAIGAGAIWVLAAPRSTSSITFHPVKNTAALWAIDPRTNETVATPIRLKHADDPIALAVAGNRVWVGDYANTVIEFRLTPGASRRRR